MTSHPIRLNSNKNDSPTLHLTSRSFRRFLVIPNPIKPIFIFSLILIYTIMSLTSTMDDTKMFNFQEESQSERLARKSKETPFFPIAIGACTMAVAYGAYMFKNRGKMSPSVYLMHLRVTAQGAAVGSLTLGLMYTMFNEYIAKKK